jgi:hypothetical protein
MLRRWAAERAGVPDEMVDARYQPLLVHERRRSAPICMAARSPRLTAGGRKVTVAICTNEPEGG